VDLFHDRLSDYQATVVRTRDADLPGEIAGRIESARTRRLVVPATLPYRWIETIRTGGVEVVEDQVEEALSHAVLAGVQGVLTGCALAIAETGTLILDGGDAQGRRALSLLPDYHLCVVFMDQIVETVPEAVERLAGAFNGPPPPITFISGPSATSDIELIRVEGVHGPRTLDVILVEGSRGDL